MIINPSAEYSLPFETPNAALNTKLLRVNHRVNAKAFQLLLKPDIWIVVPTPSNGDDFVKPGQLEGFSKCKILAASGAPRKQNVSDQAASSGQILPR
jgi:hypothetical protein